MRARVMPSASQTSSSHRAYASDARGGRAPALKPGSPIMSTAYTRWSRLSEATSRIQVLADPSTGEIRRTEVSWERIKGSIVVTYGPVPGVPVPVPIAMSERFTTRAGDEIEGDAAYTNYRRFETSGRVILP